MELQQTKKVLHSEGNNEQNEKAACCLLQMIYLKKGLIFKICIEPIQLNIKKQTTQFEKNG